MGLDTKNITFFEALKNDVRKKMWPLSSRGGGNLGAGPLTKYFFAAYKYMKTSLSYLQEYFLCMFLSIIFFMYLKRHSVRTIHVE